LFIFIHVNDDECGGAVYVDGDDEDGDGDGNRYDTSSYRKLVAKYLKSVTIYLKVYLSQLTIHLTIQLSILSIYPYHHISSHKAI